MKINCKNLQLPYKGNFMAVFNIITLANVMFVGKVKKKITKKTKIKKIKFEFW